MCEAVGSKNLQKKCRKKQMRCQAIIEKDTQVIFSETPTINIVICNSGLSNGLTLEQVIESFSIYGPIADVLMLQGKSYCYLIFKDISSAEKAYNSCNGILNLAQDEKPLYLGYAKEFQNLELSTNFDKPSGLTIIENVISTVEEDVFIKLIKVEDSNKNENQQLKHRFVKHYGYEFKYDINNVDRNTPLSEKIPHECEKLFKHMNIIPDQLTVNCYNPGQGIPQHVDTHSAFDGAIVSLSLGSDIIMEFKKDGQTCSVLLPRRSLAIMDGESRYEWTHGITPRKLDVIQDINGLTVRKRQVRVSYTFRKVNMKGICCCKYPSKCDTRRNLEINDEAARKLEDLHVQQVYNNIASHFSDTRHKPWPNVLEFIQSFELGSVVLDIGCGNGKNIGHNVKSFEIGCDNSTGLLSLCRERNLEALAGNCLQVPFKDEIADGAISIAVIHHLGSETRRRQAVAQMLRILRVGGKALIYVWAKDQNREDKSSYLKQDRKNRKSSSCVEDIGSNKKVNVSENVALTVHTNRKQFAEQDMLVPWKLKGKENENEVDTEFLRFYHVFEELELLLLVKSFTNVNILKYYYDQGNWCVIFQKIN